MECAVYSAKGKVWSVKCGVCCLQLSSRVSAADC